MGAYGCRGVGMCGSTEGDVLIGIVGVGSCAASGDVGLGVKRSGLTAQRLHDLS